MFPYTSVQADIKLMNNFFYGVRTPKKKKSFIFLSIAMHNFMYKFESVKFCEQSVSPFSIKSCTKKKFSFLKLVIFRITIRQ